MVTTPTHAAVAMAKTREEPTRLGDPSNDGQPQAMTRPPRATAAAPGSALRKALSPISAHRPPGPNTVMIRPPRADGSTVAAAGWRRPRPLAGIASVGAA